MIYFLCGFLCASAIFFSGVTVYVIFAHRRVRAMQERMRHIQAERDKHDAAKIVHEAAKDIHEKKA